MATGFGAGPFGGGGFGAWIWANAQFIQTLPAVYRDQDDLAGGGRLRGLLEAIAPSFDNIRIDIRDLGELRDPLKCQTDKTFEESVQIIQVDDIGDGTSRVFISVGPDGDKFVGVRPGHVLTDVLGQRFVISEVHSSALVGDVPDPPVDPETSELSGKHLIVKNVSFGSNIVIPLVSSTSYANENPTPSPVDNGTNAGPYTFTVANPPLAANRIEIVWKVGGEDRIGYFTNIGKRSGNLAVGSSVNFTTGVVVVATGGEIVDSDTLRISYFNTLVPVSDASSIQAQHILAFLASDHGIDIDRHDPETLQRSLVYHAWQLWDIKSSEESYEVLGKMAGYFVKASGLYRINSSWITSLPASNVFEIPTGSGKYYTDIDPLGALFDELAADVIPLDLLCHSNDYPTQVQSVVVASVTAQHEEGTLTRYTVTVTTSDGHLSFMTHGHLTDSGADVFAAESFVRISSTSYSFEVLAAAPPALGAASFEWEVVKLDNTGPVDMHIVGIGTDLEVIGEEYSGFSGVRYKLTWTFSGVQSIGGVGNWALIDANGVISWIEKISVSGTTYEFEFVAGSAPPNDSDVNIFYACTSIASCSYCRASVIRVAITTGSLLDLGAEELSQALSDDALGRLIERMTQLIPAHVDVAEFSFSPGPVVAEFSMIASATTDYVP